ncbi:MULTISPECIES: carboxylesterase [unclassified Lentimonas]|uniref:alpha/beta hydrolase n=1 Tax=unclassified Lentimonas TaxID=2630993 RepID=UPI00132948CE|nr:MULTISPECIES: alpha/beta fold hydrolase [unclassified Lentimonas]CAA6691328.1 Unannotated [Lentimonas sp. CC19]CAA6694892.1 Unannotated [Lentimonas sp. CC10]CAA7071916.1 Unannotated [Lentimonas sp. CC11]
MKKMVMSTASYALKCFLYGIVGAVVMLLIVAVKMMNNKPDLQLWHEVVLDAEFTEDSDVSSFQDYLELEDRLFQQLNELIYTDSDTPDELDVNRYTRGSLSDATAWDVNWNRSFEMPAEKAKSGVLLLHGLTDSPYSLRLIGERLNQEGAHVIGLRIPGHGTAPSALTVTTWEDMAAAVRVGMRSLKAAVGDQPLYVVGFSNGGALSVRYAIDAIEDPSLPQLEGMALLSPEIGITRMAVLSIWQERIGYVLRLNKLQWQSVLPEYDPYKYTSFPANAGMLAHNLTVANRESLKQLEADGQLSGFPNVLAFQSIVDSTVLAPALVKDLFDLLPADVGHELVVYDINRSAEIEPLLKAGKIPDVGLLEAQATRDYIFTLITNKDARNEAVEAHTYPPRIHEPQLSSIGLKWPETIYSLSHVALPFAEQDPIYGAGPRKDKTRIHLGALAIRGEKGVLSIAAADMLRLRWNPFYEYQEQRIVDHFSQK